MSELLSKLSSYNIFNYLLPWILFASISEKLTGYNLIQEDAIVWAFIYYFIWLIISRIGSLIIEPALSQINFVEFEKYEAFLKAEKKDSKIEILSETNNMYRTLIALFVLLICLVLYENIVNYYNLWFLNHYILIIGLLVMFLLSYKKQTSYITKRVKKYN